MSYIWGGLINISHKSVWKVHVVVTELRMATVVCDLLHLRNRQYHYMTSAKLQNDTVIGLSTIGIYGQSWIPLFVPYSKSSVSV